MFRRLALISIAFCLTAPLLSKPAVLFDFNGVVGWVDKIEAAKYVFSNLSGSYLDKARALVNLPYARQTIYQILNEATPWPADKAIVTDEHSNPVPYLMACWLDGTKKEEDIRALITEKTKTTSPALANAVSAVVNGAMFNAENLAYCIQLEPRMIQLIQNLRNQGVATYLLTNMDEHTYNRIMEKYPELHNLFDGQLVSGVEKINKPEPAFFTTFLERYQLDPAECCFIDDQEVNCAAARSVGIHSIACPQMGTVSKGANVRPVRKGIRTWLRTIRNMVIT